MAFDNVGVVGGGAWGTALAQSCRAAGRDVLLWALEAETVKAINDTHTNPIYLPNIPLDTGIVATSQLADLSRSDLVLVVSPAQHLRSVVGALVPHLDKGQPLVICAKGIEQSSGALLSDVVGETAPDYPVAVLSGPCFAADVAKGLPTAATLACVDEDLGQVLSHAIGHKSFRPYWSGDIIGAQIGGAVKNVLAIAAGVVEGAELGQSARSALVTRGFAELKRFGQSFGANPATLSGLSGLGDLILTCTSGQSRNMSLGRALGQGMTMAEFLAGKASVAEGVHTASAVSLISRERKIDMPICEAVRQIVSGEKQVGEVVGALLSRPFRAED